MEKQIRLGILILMMVLYHNCNNRHATPVNLDERGVRGFHGEISDVLYMSNVSQIKDSVSIVRGDIDLNKMAQWAFRALKKNPRPHMNYECIFSMSLLKYPPFPGKDEHDPIANGDTENRLDWEFGYMKDMLGDHSGDTIAQGLRKRIMGNFKDDGLCWLEGDFYSSLPGVYAHQWTTAKLLVSLSNDYKRTKNERLRSQCRKMFEALRARADWVDGRAYYAGGNSGWNNNGWVITDATPYSPAMLLEGIATYYEAFEDREAFDFAIAFAKGEIAGDQWENWIMRDPSKLSEEQKGQLKYTHSDFSIWPTAPQTINLAVRSDGSFDHHSHMRGHNGWGMAHVGYLSKDTAIIGWSKRLLDYFLAYGTDFGWIPESQTSPRRSETCAVAGVIDMAKYIALCGYPEYWDVVERFVRNYIREAQFFITPAYKELYSKLHPGIEGEKGLESVKDLQGGFLGAMGLYDRCWQRDELDMMGCCVPEGMRALHTAWSNTIVKEKDGVRINMCFGLDAKAARITSYLPQKGGMQVIAKTQDRFWLRPPSWAPRNKCKVYVNNKENNLVWRGDYIYLENINQGDIIELRYPLVSFVQKQIVKNVKGQPDRNITVKWLGNTVAHLEPIGDQLPLYQQGYGWVPEVPLD
ncbi:MAG: glycoside hydrolase family 127 protein [Chitinophagaceae bacterium]|nr:glycoside hydrolase family 127 protein [Chitinophagaceae bacterium]